MIEIIDVAAGVISLLQGIDLLIGRVEPRVEAAKEFRHREVRFRMADVGSRVDQPGVAVGSGHEVAAPEITV